MMTQDLIEAINAIKAGDKKTGHQLLVSILKDNPQNEDAWLWVLHVVNKREDKIKCLEKVLKINPNNELARKGLTRLKSDIEMSTLEDIVPEEIKKPKNKPKFSILVIDDLHETRRFLNTFLADEYEVFQARNGSEGLRKIKHHKPDVVILDYKMHHFDGIQVLKELRTQRIPTRVIMCSFHLSTDQMIECIRLGASDVLQKPFTVEELRERVAWVLATGSTIGHRAKIDDLQQQYKNEEQLKTKFEQENKILKQANLQMSH
ncbi:MAG: response regulator [Anaerolineae bacterium]|nr:response regulator [Anaerolineae bacterium]